MNMENFNCPEFRLNNSTKRDYLTNFALSHANILHATKTIA